MEYKNIKIVDYTYDGLGIGKADGFPLFVSNACVGDVVDVVVTKQKKNLAFCEVSTYHKTSCVQPICPYYGECGGCHIMHMSYTEQLRFKTNHVKETIKRIGKTEPIVYDCVGMNNPYHYRNKLMIPFRDGIAGLYKKGTHSIVDMDTCYLLDEYAFQIVRYLKKYSELIHVMIRSNHSKTEYMVVLVTEKELNNEIAYDLKDKFDRITSVINSLNPTRSNVVIQDNYRVLYGFDEYSETLLGIHYKINHQSFFQVNFSQTEMLYSLAIQAFDVTDKTVIDAYAGLGSIGLSFAKKAKHVYAIEANDSAVQKGREIAKTNSINNITYISGKSEDVIASYLTEDIDLLITDPPRKGCDEKFLDSLMHSTIENLVYVSCNVATLARDIDYLSEEFDCIEVTPVDMFPHTHHVECVAKLTRK